MLIKNIYKNYGKKNVLVNVTVQFEKGKVNTLIGINGSGKSTLMNAITSLVEINQGSINIDGYPHFSPEAKAIMFYIPADFFLPDYLSGSEYAMYIFNVYTTYNKALFETLITVFNFGINMNKLISEYSYGMRKKLQIIVAFALNVSYIICDELLNGLDSESILIVEELVKLKRNCGTTFIIATHELDFVKCIADHIFLLKNGNIIQLTLETDLRKELSYEIKLSEKIAQISRVI